MGGVIEIKLGDSSEVDVQDSLANVPVDVSFLASTPSGLMLY
jgi:hypothetical protein